MLDVQGLAAFVAIADQGSFARAAEHLGIAQSVISKRLRRLEDRLGGQLIDRDRRHRIKLTRIGELYLPEARKTLDQLGIAERVGMDLALGHRGPVRIGFIFSAAINGTLVGLLRTLRNSFPDLALQPHMMETPEQLDAIDTGSLDIGLVRARPSYPEGCDYKVVMEERLALFYAQDHPLTMAPVVSAGQLADECFVVPQFRERVGLILNLEQLARVGRFSLKSVIRTEDYVTAAALVATGVGVALAPVSMTRLQMGGLAMTEISDFRPFLEVLLVGRSNLPPDIKSVMRNWSSTEGDPIGDTGLDHLAKLVR